MNPTDGIDELNALPSDEPPRKDAPKGQRPKSQDATGERERPGGTRGPEPTSPAPSEDAPGAVIGGRYEILERVGQGRMGVLYRATDRRLRQEVVLKRLRAAEESARKGIARFAQEAAAIAGLNHRNVVAIHDVGQDDKGPFVVMDYLRGEDLRRRIERAGNMGLGEALSIIKSVGQGLAYAHSKGILHRNLKPSNIFLTEDGTPKLVDFGLAPVYGQPGPPGPADSQGAWAYVSPEQVSDPERIGRRADIYSLAKTLYHMLTGNVPDVIDWDLVPSEIRSALEKALDPARERRPSSVKEFLADLGLPAGVVDIPLAPGTVLPGTCLQCGAANTQGVKFCDSCGAGLFEKCPRCSVESSMGVRFCGSCGANIPAYKAAKNAVASAQNHLKGFRYDDAEREASQGLRLGYLTDELKEVLERAATAKKKLVELRTRARDLVEQGRYEDAEEPLRGALELNPSDTYSLKLLSQLSAKIKDRNIRRALADASKALEEKRFPVALERCEWVLNQATPEGVDNEEASSVKSQAERLREDHRTRLAEARKSSDASRFKEAMEQLSSLQKDYPWDDEIMELLRDAGRRKNKKLDELRAQAMELIDSERYEDAESPLRNAVQLDPSQEDLQELLNELPARIRGREMRRALAEASDALDEKRFPVALERCERVLKEQPDNEEASELKSRAERLREDHDAGASLARKSLDASRFNEALEQLRTLESEYPWDGEIKKLLEDAGRRKKKKLDELRAQAMELIDSERYEDAQTPLRSAIQLDPSQEDLQALLDELPARIRGRELRQALAEASKALEEKQFPVAIQLCDRVLQEQPENREAAVLKVHAERLRKDHDLRLARATELLEAPQLADALDHLADLETDYPWDTEIKKLHATATGKKKTFDQLRVQAIELVSKERYEDAEGPLRSALELDRSQKDLKALLDNLPARIRGREIRRALAKARQALQEKRFQDTLDGCDWVLEQEPSNKEAAALKARGQKLRQDHESRLERARKSLDVLDASELNKAIVELSDIEKDYPWDQDARKLHREATTRRETIVADLRAEAGQLIEKGLYEEAEDPLSGALKLDPTQRDLEDLRKGLPAKIRQREIQRLLLEARKALQEKRFSVALEHSNWVLREQPSNREAAEIKAHAVKLQSAAKPIALFGNYEAVAKHSQTPGATVWTARPLGSSSAPAFAIKAFDPSGSGWNEQRIAAERNSFADSIRTQQTVSAGDGRRWVPILESETEGQKPFFVTNYYRRSVQWLLDRPFSMSSRTLHAIVSAVVQGLVELRQACRRPHGNLKPSNILIEGEGRITRNKVALTDPSPTSRLGPEASETSDLQAIGKLIYELALRRPFRLMGGWPVPRSEAWSRLGKGGETWRKLCDRLLDPDPVRSKVSLELVAEVLRILDRPRKVRRYAAVAASAAVVVAVPVLFWVKSLQLPKIRLVGKEAMTVEAGSAFEDPGWKATDRQDGDLTGKVQVTGRVDVTKLVEHVLNYTVKDSSGNKTEATRRVKVVDTKPPAITLKGDPVVRLEAGTKYEEPGYTAQDSYDGDITGKVSVQGSVDHTKVAEYALTYRVNDSSGNRAEEKKRTVRVVDVTAPVIALSGADPMTLEVGSAFKDPGCSAKDKEDGDLTRKVKVAGVVDAAKLGEYMLTYTVADSSGNEAKATRTVKVVDTKPPAITLKGESVVRLGVGLKYEEPGYTAQDSYDGDITNKVSVQGSVDHTKVGEYELTYKAADSSGNRAEEKKRTVKVVDVTAPVIALSRTNAITLEVDTPFKDPGWKATDGQDGDLTGKVEVAGAVDVTKLGEYTLTYTVSDSSSNKAEVTRTVKVVDTTRPVITLKGDSVVSLGVGVKYQEPGYTARDSHEGDISSKVAVEGSVDSAKIGEYTLVYRASDSSGNRAEEKKRSVRVVDITAPVIALSGSEVMTHEAGSAFKDPGYTAADKEDGDLTGKVKVAGAVDVAKLGEHKLTYTVTDSSGNEAKATRTVKVVDTKPPAITLRGESVVRLGVGEKYQEPGYGAQDNYDGDITGRVMVEGSVDTMKPGECVLTYNVSDSSGNRAEEKKRTVRVVDITAPVIVLSGGQVMTVEAGSAFKDPGWKASDKEEGDLTGKVKVAGSVDAAKLGEYTLTYTVADSSRNEAEATRTVNVADTKPPVITLKGSDVVAVGVKTKYEEPGFTATDSYDGDITSKVAVEGSVDTATAGEYSLIYRVSDSSGNPAEEKKRTVRVVDVTAPVIALSGADPMTLEVGSAFEDPGCSATDKEDGDLTGKVKVAGAVDVAKLGEYKLTYTVTDSSGNEAKATRTVNVVDTKPPVITLKGQDLMTLGVGTKYREPGCAARDNYDGDITSKVAVEGSVDSAKIGEYFLIYSVADSTGNPAEEKKRTVRVVDITAPVIALSGADPMTVEVGTPFKDPGWKATDKEDGDLTGKVKLAGVVDVAKLGEYKLIYTVTDTSGNEAKATRTVKVVDTTRPVITLKGDSVVRLGVGEKYQEPGYAAQDSYQGDITSKVSVQGSVDTTKPGECVLTYNVSDSSGNAAQAKTRTVRVADVTAPVIALVGGEELTVEAGTPFKEPGWKATDSQDGDLTREVKATGVVDVAKLAEYKLTYAVRDSTGNRTELTRTVKVVDRKPPDATDFSPARSQDVPVATNITLHIRDAGVGVNRETIKMMVNGRPVEPNVTGSAADYTLSYKPPAPFGEGEKVTVAIDADDVKGNRMERKSYSFTTGKKPPPPSEFDFAAFFNKCAADFADEARFKEYFADPDDAKWLREGSLRGSRPQRLELVSGVQQPAPPGGVVFKVVFKAHFEVTDGFLRGRTYSDTLTQEWQIDPNTTKIIMDSWFEGLKKDYMEKFGKSDFNTCFSEAAYKDYWIHRYKRYDPHFKSLEQLGKLEADRQTGRYRASLKVSFEVLFVGAGKPVTLQYEDLWIVEKRGRTGIITEVAESKNLP